MQKPTRIANNLAQNYGLTVEAFEQMYLDQRGRCAICSKRMYARDCHVDHDHETGKVRKLLCHTCNIGLGMFKDNIALLARAIVYLEEHGKEY